MNLRLDDKKSFYKLTEIGEIPADWEIKSMNDICSRIVVGIASSTSEYYTSKGNGIPIIRNQNIKENRLNLSDVLYITEEFDLINKKKRLRTGDILTVRTGYPGITAVVTEEQKDFQTFTTLISTPDEEKINSDFLAYYMNSPIGKKLLTSMSAGGAQQNLNVSSLAKLKVIIPSLKEQKKITEILMIADKQIEKTEQLIEKVQELKKGLMQKLFNKGINNKNYKNTDMGNIPVEWEVELIDDVAHRKSGHTPNKKINEYWNGEIPWISLKDLPRLDKRYVKETTDYTSLEGIKNSSAVILPPGTIIVSRDATVGKIGITTKEMATSQHFINYICSERVNNIFLYYYFLYKKKMFTRIAAGSTIKTIGLDFFKKLKIIVPPIEEQRKIADILFAVDDQIEIYKNEKEKQIELKKALMQQLLTGKIRVTV